MRGDGSLQSVDPLADVIEPLQSHQEINNNYRWSDTETRTDTLHNAAPGDSMAGAVDKDTTPIYRYQNGTLSNIEKDALRKELEQKQKEIEELKKKLDSHKYHPKGLFSPRQKKW